jgi:hypothetical protein
MSQSMDDARSLFGAHLTLHASHAQLNDCIMRDPLVHQQLWLRSRLCRDESSKRRGAVSLQVVVDQDQALQRRGRRKFRAKRGSVNNLIVVATYRSRLYRAQHREVEAKRGGGVSLQVVVPQDQHGVPTHPLLQPTHNKSKLQPLQCVTNKWPI